MSLIIQNNRTIFISFSPQVPGLVSSLILFKSIIWFIKIQNRCNGTGRVNSPKKTSSDAKEDVGEPKQDSVIRSPWRWSDARTPPGVVTNRFLFASFQGFCLEIPGNHLVWTISGKCTEETKKMSRKYLECPEENVWISEAKKRLYVEITIIIEAVRNKLMLFSCFTLYRLPCLCDSCNSCNSCDSCDRVLVCYWALNEVIVVTGQLGLEVEQCSGLGWEQQQCEPWICLKMSLHINWSEMYFCEPPFLKNTREPKQSDRVGLKQNGSVTFQDQMSFPQSHYYTTRSSSFDLRREVGKVRTGLTHMWKDRIGL